MEDKAYYPSLTALSDQAVLLVVPELEEELEPILNSEEDVEYKSRWFLNKDNKQLVLQIDWSTGDQSNIILSDDQQKQLYSELLEKGKIGLMYDFDPESEEKTSGVLLISNVDKGLKDISEQLD